MPQNPLPLFAVVLRNLREQVGWTQGALEREAGLPRGRVSQLESGDRPLERVELELLVGVLGFAWPSETIDRAAAGVALFPVLEQAVVRCGAGLRDQRLVEANAALLVRAVDTHFCEVATPALVAARWRRDREEAARNWELLRKEPEVRRKVLVTSVECFQTWAMCERLCAESVRAATHNADTAKKFSDLALLGAMSTESWEAWRDYLRGYTWAFVANARRVGGDLREADGAFDQSDVLSGTTHPLGCPLDPTCRLSLKATLRKNQRRYDEALQSLAEALSITCVPMQTASLRIQRASILEKAGAYDEALADLTLAELLLDESPDMSLRLQLEFCRALNLWHLDRLSDACDTLEKRIKPLTLELGRNLDRLRVRWLEARIEEGFGRRNEAVAGFQEVWQGFADLDIPFDAALAALELAANLLASGRTQAVRALAGNAAPIFAAQEMPRELLASLHLFWASATKEEATEATARHLLRELHRLGPERRNS